MSKARNEAQAKPQNAYLSLVEVSKNFGPRTILTEINLTLQPSTLTLLTGNNGSGKSTLLKIMAGLSQPSHGKVILGHKDPDTELILSYVGHATFLYPHLTALENLNFWQRCLGLNLSEDDLLDHLARVGLLDHADSYPRAFSRGMCQKLNIARSLLQKPDLLLLDEPSTGLDQAAKLWLRTTLEGLRKEGSCIVLISHDLEQDSPLADTILRLEQKKCFSLTSGGAKCCGS